MVELSSIEDIDKELIVVVNGQKTYFDRNLHVLPYVRSLDFKYKFSSIQKTVCPNCGREYRITHFCDIMGDQIWGSNWKTILHPLYKDHIGKPYNQKEIEKQYRKNPSFILEEERKNDPNALIFQLINEKPRKDAEHPRKDKKPQTMGGLCLCAFLVAIGFVILLRIYSGGFDFF